MKFLKQQSAALAFSFVIFFAMPHYSAFSQSEPSGASVEGQLTTLPIQKDPILIGGTIVSSKKLEMFERTKELFVISYAPATGVPNNASYQYQWQASDNCVSWKDIRGATGANLTVAEPPCLTTFYRRSAWERVSNTIMYSDVVTLFIIPICSKGFSYL